MMDVRQCLTTAALPNAPGLLSSGPAPRPQEPVAESDEPQRATTEITMTKQIALTLAYTTALLLTGCGGADETNSSNGGGGSTKIGETAVATSAWDATNACALLDKAAVAAALKDTVTEASVALVHQASGAEAATSECTYILASGGRATFMTRNSPIADNTEAAIALARKATQKTVSMFTDKKVEDVPGLGKAAFFVPGVNQLNVFIDDRRFVILTLSSAPDATAKAASIALVGNIKA